MSRAETYKIEKNGDVTFAFSARNSFGGAYAIWETLRRKHNVPEGGAMNRFDEVWKLPQTKKLDETDLIVLTCTFDRVWVRHENIPRLIAALEAFWPQMQKYLSATIADTVPLIVEGLRDFVLPMKEIRGICFNHTSVNVSPWTVYDGDEEGRPFNFDKDKTINGKPLFELFETVEEFVNAMEGKKLFTVEFLPDDASDESDTLEDNIWAKDEGHAHQIATIDRGLNVQKVYPRRELPVH